MTTATVANDELMDAKQLADFLKAPLRTVRHWAKIGRLPVALQIGKTRRFRLADVKTAINWQPPQQ